jgi:hypothetical protein
MCVHPIVHLTPIVSAPLQQAALSSDGPQLTQVNPSQASLGTNSTPLAAADVPQPVHPPVQRVDPNAIAQSLADRTDKVQTHFPNAMSADDFLARVEVALAAYGFRGDNSLSLTNVCRDEATGILKSKIDEIYGHSFNINGLGAVLTCGVTGIGAGLSHAPIDSQGRERYVFFALPHIAVDETGEPAAIYRPGRAGKGAACGALLYAVNAVKEGGIAEDAAGTHDPMEPEGSILMSRLKEQMRMEKVDPSKVDVVEMTKACVPPGFWLAFAVWLLVLLGVLSCVPSHNVSWHYCTHCVSSPHRHALVCQNYVLWIRPKKQETGTLKCASLHSST